VPMPYADGTKRPPRVSRHYRMSARFPYNSAGGGRAPVQSAAGPSRRRLGVRVKGMAHDLKQLVEDLHREEEAIRLRGGRKAIERQHEKGRLTARERLANLLDADTPFFELGLWAAWGMYQEWGGAPSAGVVTGIGSVAGRRVMVIANDATVKAG